MPSATETSGCTCIAWALLTGFTETQDNYIKTQENYIKL